MYQVEMRGMSRLEAMSLLEQPHISNESARVIRMFMSRRGQRRLCLYAAELATGGAVICVACLLLNALLPVSLPDAIVPLQHANTLSTIH